MNTTANGTTAAQVNNNNRENQNAANMGASYNYNGTAFKMSATFKGYKSGVFGDNMTRPHFIVSIRTEDGNRTRFNFYGSFNDYQKGKKEMNRDDLRDALECFLSDGLSYDNAADFADFCAEFGYDEASEGRARRAFNGCKRHHEAAARLFGNNYAEILNEINDEQ